jgi:eukaryotic-like serine/threonine-protein kinase
VATVAEPRRLGGRYEIGAVLGYGGMAEVLRGRDVRLGRDVAVKILRPDLARDPAFQARFRREAQSAASLNHPAIVAVYDTGEDAQNGVTTPYIVMEYVEGRTLREVLQTEGALMPTRALEIVAGVCDALQYSHAAGIIHRDIKPANVMLTPSGAIKVMDFGIARAVTAAAATMTQTAAVIGTAQYLSPEQARGEVVDARSDIYSTGCLLYELLTGRPPFVGDSPVAVAYQHVREDAVPPSVLVPDLEPSVDAIVMKALAKNPANRYQTAAEMQADITRALSGRPVLATPVLFEAQTQVMAAPVHETMSVRPARREHPFLRGFAYLLLFGAVAAMVFGGVYELHKSFGPTTAKTATVPDLKGLNLKAAENDIKKNGLVPVPLTGNSGKAKGTVYNQSPVEGVEARPSSEVTFYISLGAAQVPVPDVKGSTLEGAVTTLRAQKFVQGLITYQDGTTIKGQVISTNPKAGTKVSAGSTVALTVGSGMVVVPDVTGKPEQIAQQAIINAGLTYTEVRTFGPQTPGTVRFQSFKGGKKVALGTVVDITVTIGPKPKPIVTTPATTPPATAGTVTSPPAGATTPPAAGATTTAPAVPPPAGATTTAAPPAAAATTTAPVQPPANPTP